MFEVAELQAACSGITGTKFGFDTGALDRSALDETKALGKCKS